MKARSVHVENVTENYHLNKNCGKLLLYLSALPIPCSCCHRSSRLCVPFRRLIFCTQNLKQTLYRCLHRRSFFRKKVQSRELGILAEVESKTFSRLVPRLAQVGDFIFTSFYFSRFPFLFFFRTCFLFTPIFWLVDSELEHSNSSLNEQNKF